MLTKRLSEKKQPTNIQRIEKSAAGEKSSRVGACPGAAASIVPYMTTSHPSAVDMTYRRSMTEPKSSNEPGTSRGFSQTGPPGPGATASWREAAAATAVLAAAATAAPLSAYSGGGEITGGGVITGGGGLIASAPPGPRQASRVRMVGSEHEARSPMKSCIPSMAKTIWRVTRTRGGEGR